MFCKKCGEEVTGKYCSNCGTKVTNRMEELRKAERKAQKDYEYGLTHNASGVLLPDVNGHLVSACWMASKSKYGWEFRVLKDDPENIPDEAFERLKIVREHAVKLYLALIQF